MHVVTRKLDLDQTSTAHTHFETPKFVTKSEFHHCDKTHFLLPILVYLLDMTVGMIRILFVNQNSD